MSKSPPDQLKKPNEHHTAWLLRRVWNRMNVEDGHFMGVIVGREGMGKSHTALKIAETVDPTFSEDRVIFDVKELLTRLRDDVNQKGSFYILDEAGVQLGKRTWQERGQVLANQALQLVRDHNIGVIFTLPRLGELDSQTQGRLQAFYEIGEKVDGEYVRGKWKWLDPDRADQTGTIYKKYPRRRMGQGGYVKRISSIAFTPPSEDVVNPYEVNKSAFQQQFYDKTIEELGGDGSPGGDESQSIEDLAEEIANNGVAEYTRTHNQTGENLIDSDLLYTKEDVTVRESRALKKLIENKVDVEKITPCG